MRIALAIVVIAFSARAANLTGTVIDETGAYIAHAAVELASGTNNYRVQADDTGVYQFSNLPAGEYMLTFRVPGFPNRRVMSIGLLEAEQKRIPDVILDVDRCGWPLRDIVLLRGTLFGTLSGSVDPPAKDVDVTLICRTFSACSSTRTDSNGRFSFETLPAGVYGLNFQRPGFYPENATEYRYTVNAGWESVYRPMVLEQCLTATATPSCARSASSTANNGVIIQAGAPAMGLSAWLLVAVSAVAVEIPQGAHVMLQPPSASPATDALRAEPSWRFISSNG